MEDFNIYGWTPLHEACYKGYINAVARFLDHARDSSKNLMEQRTIDEYKSTPLLIAALGGHLDLIEFLIKNGADISAKLDYKGLKHGIVEVAVIREDIPLLCYLYEKVTDLPKRMRDMLGVEKLDQESRTSVGRTIQKLSLEYPNRVNKAWASVIKPASHLTKEQEISLNAFNHPDFGDSLAKYIKLCDKSEDCVVSGIMILINLASDATIRTSFTLNKGINHLISCLDRDRKELITKLETIRKRINADEPRIIIHLEDYLSMECATIGQALCVLSKYEDCLEFINNEGLNDQIQRYILVLFEFNELQSKVTTANSNMEPDVLTFEHLIGAYLICLANLVHKSVFNKQCFLNLNMLEPILKFWKYIYHQYRLLNFNNILHRRLEALHSESIIDYLNTRKESMKISESSRNYNLSPALIKHLKLVLIECLGNVMFNHDDLKKRYVFSYDKNFLSQSAETDSLVDINENNNESLSFTTNYFIRTLTSLLNDHDRELQIEILKFIRLVCDNDFELQQRLIPTCNIENSTLVASLRQLLRKNCPLNVRILSLFSLWTLSGASNFHSNYDRKCRIYRSIGAQKYIDMLIDAGNGSDDITLRCLETFETIASAPPYRKTSDDTKNNQLLLGQDEIAEVHAIPEILRLITTKTISIQVLFAVIRTIESLCVGTCYSTNNQNQISLEKMGTLSSLVEIVTKGSPSDRLKCEAYYCMSMLCLNNQKNRKHLVKCLANTGMNFDTLTKELIRLMNLEQSPTVLNKNETFDTNEIENITTRIRAGLAICAFSYKQDEFIDRILRIHGRFEWSMFCQLYTQLNRKLASSYIYKDQDSHYFCLKIRCFFGFQISALYHLIQIEPKQDPRAIGIKLIMDVLLSRNANALLKSIACDYMGRLVRFNEGLVESLICVNGVEILAKSIAPGVVGDIERGNAAITLGIFTVMNAEARRRVIKLARKSNGLMEGLIYFNRTIHVELIRQWRHFKELKDKKEILEM